MISDHWHARRTAAGAPCPAKLPLSRAEWSQLDALARALGGVHCAGTDEYWPAWQFPDKSIVSHRTLEQ